MSGYAPLMELIKGAKKVMNFHVKPGEDVLIVTTTDQEAVIPNALALAVQMAGANEVVVASILSRSKEKPDVPKSVLEAAKNSDIVFRTSKSSLAYTSITPMAGKSGGKLRSISMDITPEQLKSGGIMADYNKIRELTLKLCNIENSKQARVITDAGTDLTFRLGRKCCEFYGIPHGTGMMPWWASAPDGEAMTAPIEDTAEGKLVIDVSLVSCIEALPSYILAQPIELEIKKSTIVDIKGGAEAAALKKVLEKSDENSRKLCEFAIGTNPESKIYGRHEDKKRLGTCHFAIGTNEAFGGKIKSGVHVDLVANNPTIILDGKTIIKKGN